MHVFVEPGVSGRSVDNRSELAKALTAVEDGTARALIVAKLDRLSRLVRDA